MTSKYRFESEELKLLRYLSLRMNLSAKEEHHYWNLEKGLEGEKVFDVWLEGFSDDWVVLNDLLFEINHTLFQIDTLLISQETVYLFNVKNYDGDYFIEDDRWYTISGTEIKSPLLQLRRCESLFRQLLKMLGFHFSVESHLVFVNPGFYLYQAPLNLPAVFPTQLNRFMNQLKKSSSPLQDKHRKLADQLLSIHIKESPYTRLPDYHYEQLRKGIVCANCDSFHTELSRRKIVCRACGRKENVDAAVLRSVEEFRMLFPDQPVTTTAVHEWCGIIASRKIIWRILANNFELRGEGRATHYV